jgi:hypothetical protein
LREFGFKLVNLKLGPFITSATPRPSHLMQ